VFAERVPESTAAVKLVGQFLRSQLGTAVSG
jgi:hypothetical protein